MSAGSADCPVCFDKYTAQLRKAVCCPYCDYNVCTICCKRYLTEGVLDAHCMNCRRAWNDEFLDLNFTRAFRTGPYKKHREDVLFERELSLLPTRQPRVEAKHKLREVEGELKKINEAVAELEKKKQEILRKSHQYTARLARYTAESEGRAPPAWTLGTGEAAPDKERAKFIMKCPDGGCRGFLSSAYKCGTCQKWFCNDCLECKGDAKDAEHTCNQQTKETVALIIKESRPCPKCGERISKIDGCFAKGTPILMWDGGRVKMSEDIKVGDELIGDDGEKRTVTELCSGIDEMYEVNQRDGMTYVVNSKHKLCLKFSSEKTLQYSSSEDKWVMRWFDRENHCIRSKKADTEDELKAFRDTLQFDEVIEMTVEEYLELGESVKDHLMGFKAAGINWPSQEVKLDPYVMGLWLGDGINDGMSFAISPEADPEIVSYLLDWCKKNDAELVHDEAYRFRIRQREVAFGRLAIGRGATSEECKGCKQKKCSACDLPDEPYTSEVETGKRNPLRGALDYYGLLKDKHIPRAYLANDRESRLKLLAGLIDSDGYVGNNGKRIQIPQVRHGLACQIEFLARSLGFITHVDVLKKSQVPFPGKQRKDYSDQLRVSISGVHLDEIPTQVARKKCVASNPNKDWLRTKISVTPIGQGTYYGWSVTGNKRFLMADTTVLRNCDQMWCIDCHTAFSWTTGQIVNGVIHNPHYYEFLRKQGNGTAPRNAGDVPCGGVPYYHHLQTAIGRKISYESQRRVMAIHRVTQEIQDYRMANYQGHFNVNDNGDLGVMYLMREIDKEPMKAVLAQREAKRNKQLAIRAVLEMFVNTSTMMLNNMVSHPPVDDASFAPTLVEYDNLRKYVNDSLLQISRMKSCSVPQLGDAFEWKPFNKAPKVARPVKEKKAKKKEKEVESDSEEDSVVSVST